MLKRVEILVDNDLLQEVIQRYHLADAREAVYFALKAVLSENVDGEHPPEDDECDEFSDLNAWQLHRGSDTA